MNKFHFLYKVTCKDTGRYYIGVHSTQDLDDGYEGSGSWVRNYRKKHGKGKLQKEILQFFDSRKVAEEAERSIVTEELIRFDPLCKNMIPGGTGFTPELASKVNKGRTKENDSGRRSMAEKLSGRTKETYEYLEESGKKISKKLKGRTKETHSYIADVAAIFRTRNKDNHEGVKSQSEKLTGRTKETHSGIRRQSEKMVGRTKETHDGVLRQSLKVRKISPEQDIEIAKLRTEGLSIHQIIEKLNLQVTYYTVVNSIKRGMKLIDNE